MVLTVRVSAEGYKPLIDLFTRCTELDPDDRPDTDMLMELVDNLYD